MTALYIYIYIYIIKKKSGQDDITPKKKSREKRKEKKAATVQKLNPNWPYSNGSKLEEKKKRFNKPNVYCSGIGAFYIVNRLLCFSHCFLQTSKSKSTLELTRSVYIIYALLLKWYIVHFVLHLFSID